MNLQNTVHCKSIIIYSITFIHTHMKRTDARGHKIRIDVILNETVHNFVMNRKVLIKNIRRKCNPKIEI